MEVSATIREPCWADVLADIRALKAECELLARIVKQMDEIEQQVDEASTLPGDPSYALLM